MLTVTYELTIDDMVALTLDRMTWSKQWRRARILRPCISAISSGLVAFLIFYDIGMDARIALALLVAIAIGVYTALPHRWKKQYALAVRKGYAEGKNLTLLGEHHLTLDDDYIKSETPMVMSCFRWDIVERISDAPGHILIYISAMSAIIVPKRAFAQTEEANTFLAEVRRLWEASRGRDVDLTAPPPWAKV